MNQLASGFRGAPFRQPVAVPDPISTFMPKLRPRRYWAFWVALVVGVAALIGLTDATLSLHSVGLEDAFVVLGSLLVPSLYVFYLDLHNRFLDPRWRTVVMTFILGAVLAAPLAIILELIFHTGAGAFGPALGTGLIEEFCKAVALFWLMRQRHRFLSFEMDGIILGAAAGMGFAAIEDLLYAASAFQHGLNAVVATVWARAILSAFGHGTWTAIVGGAIWRAKGSGPPRLTLSVLGAYLLAVALHTAWDWQPLPGLAGIVWILAVGIAGLLVLRGMMHQALQQEQDFLAHTAPVPTPAGG